MKYRGDIDGLRAIAVVAVILSHAGLPSLAGGFIGVDVFFVISGYLITSILLSEMKHGTYSLVGFYERRARRILPGLLLVIAVTTPFAWFLMFPDFRENFGQSVVATLLFSNNLLLAKTSGYWALESSFKPLLHTWSLGVEEQFYIAFPLLLALIWRFGARAQISVLTCLAILSFGISEFGWRHYPAASFYLPITRAWELMIGCLCAYHVPRQRAWDGGLALLGLAAIVGSIFAFDAHTPSPSWFMAIPTLGTALVILFNRPTFIAHRVLSLKPVVAVGLISYSAYLWHQPLFSLTRVAMTEQPGVALMLGLSALSLGLAWATWRFVETPFRTRRVGLPAFTTAAGATCAILVASGLALHFAQGFPRTVFPNLDDDGDVYISYNERIRSFTGRDFQPGKSPSILLIGNSFGRDIANALIETGWLDTDRLSYLPIDPESYGQDKNSRTEDLVASADVVLLVVAHDSATSVRKTVRFLSEKTRAPVIIFGPKHFGHNLNPFARIPLTERPFARSRIPADVVQLNQDLILALKGERYIDLLRLFGDGSKIAIFNDDGNPLSPDRIHLTKYGARFLARKLLDNEAGVLTAIRSERNCGIDTCRLKEVSQRLDAVP